MLNKLLINSVMINWDKIEESSYLRDIPALSGIDRISFTHPVTFFVGENGSGKTTLLEAGPGTTIFPPMIHTRNFVKRSGSQGVSAAQKGAIFFALRASITWRRKKRSTAGGPAAGRSITMKNLTERVSWHLCRTVSDQTDCIFRTSRKRPFHRKGS